MRCKNLHRVVCDKVCTYIAGSSVCTSCDAGKFKAAAGVNTACDNCDAGKYQATAGDESGRERGRGGGWERKKERSIYVLGHLR